MDEKIYGNQIDGKSRCVHYGAEVDIVAIKIKCCNKFYACIECHNEMEDHRAEIWKKTEFEEKVILCGNCREEIAITTYQLISECPSCKHSFNKKCINHYHLYFESV